MYYCILYVGRTHRNYALRGQSFALPASRRPLAPTFPIWGGASLLAVTVLVYRTVCTEEERHQPAGIGRSRTPGTSKLQRSTVTLALEKGWGPAPILATAFLVIQALSLPTHWNGSQQIYTLI